ncbi:MAG: ribosome recycling factor [Candidatus Portnoybacteria bacterium]|nr:ribosome recycling factor [Candidatus Portnoybacteria bacterium]
MYKDIINKLKPDFDKAIEYLKTELNGLQVGRATPALAENIIVECYGQKFSIKQLGSIHVSEPRVLIIQPWDKTILKQIEKAIFTSRPGLSAAVDGDVVRVSIASLNEEKRKELLSILSDKLEEAKITIRLRREKAWKEIQDLTRDGKIREDDKFRAKDDLQELVGDYNEKVDEMGDVKEKEIMTV